MAQFELEEVVQQAKIKVIGVGGAGGNAVNTMITNKVEGVEFYTANTDVQALEKSMAPTVIQLGKDVTRGLGAGANPEKGREAALESVDEIAEALRGADMVFVTAGMGGGTGTGAAPIVASIARELGILTVAVVTKPFQYEGHRRMSHAEEGIRDLKRHVDTVLIIPNQRLVFTDALLPGYRPAAKPFFSAALLLEPNGGGTRYTAIAIHNDEASRRQHEEMGFHDGWGTVVEQMVAHIKAAAH